MASTKIGIPTETPITIGSKFLSAGRLELWVAESLVVFDPGLTSPTNVAIPLLPAEVTSADAGGPLVPVEVGGPSVLVDPRG